MAHVAACMPTPSLRLPCTYLWGTYASLHTPACRYITVSEERQRKLFYGLVRSRRDPNTDPMKAHRR